jgi:hypothetical protein
VVPEPVPSRKDDYLVRLAADELPQPVICSLIGRTWCADALRWMREWVRYYA